MPAIFLNKAVKQLDPIHYTIRSASATVAFWAGSLVLAVVALVPIVELHWSVALFAIPIAAWLIWLLWVILLGPAVYYDARRVIVVNFAYVHVLPWPEVSSIHQGLNLVFTLSDGKRVTAAGTPYPRRGNLLPRRTTPSDRNYDGDVSVLDGFRSAAVDQGEPVEHHWDAPLLWIGAGLTLLLIGAGLVSTI